MQELKRFPIGVQDFERLRNDGKYYVDKTDLVYKMTHTDDYYFLSRPRRFGKSLLVSTLKCYFEGRKDLFTGLAIEKLETEWKKYPVLHISFAINKYVDFKTLQIVLNSQLCEWEKKYGVTKNSDDPGDRFATIIKEINTKTAMQPVVLVDEYDAPLLDSMDNPELQNTLKQEMRKFFSPLKDLGGIIRFVFLTGISKFSQLSIFSELNNLKVITMNDDYAAICGITEEELFTQMKPEIQALAEKQKLTYEQACEALKAQYDGYHFSENSPDVYNPFSLINALADKSLSNYWFATGTPTILTKLISKYDMDPKDFDEGFAATQEMFDAPTETATNPIPMLYQSGYITIKDYDGGFYTLQFPNNEVRFGFLKSLMPYYATNDVCKNDTFLLKFTKALRDEDLEQALNLTRAFISSVPYNAEKQTEAHYKTIFYLVARLCTPYVVKTEEASAAGRSDVVVETKTAVYMFEFKLDGSAEDALKQITDKGYLIQYTAITKYDGSAKALYKIGISFDTQTRTIGEWKWIKQS
ncbi:MAG TPA: AAA family ATPase [Treponema sp.]|nr:AAA family ATPase [Treponema sp.]